VLHERRLWEIHFQKSSTRSLGLRWRSLSRGLPTPLVSRKGWLTRRRRDPIRSASSFRRACAGQRGQLWSCLARQRASSREDLARECSRSSCRRWSHGRRCIGRMRPLRTLRPLGSLPDHTRARASRRRLRHHRRRRPASCPTTGSDQCLGRKVVLSDLRRFGRRR